MPRDKKSVTPVELPTVGGFLRLVAMEGVAAAIVGLQGLAVGLFRTRPGSESFVLHVLVGSLPIVVAFILALILRIPAPYVFGAAAAVLGTSIIPIILYLLGLLPSSGSELLKFAVAAYGSYVVAVYAWVYYEFRKAGRTGLHPGDYALIYKRAFQLGRQLGLRIAGVKPEPTEQPPSLPEEPVH